MSTVAVLIPTYRPGNYLQCCLQSIDRQTLDRNKFKVYIVLNGPKAEFEQYILNILNGISFKYEYVYLEQAGVSNARNKLIDISTESFITFIDDDDFISENYLQSLLNVTSEFDMGVSDIRNFTLKNENFKKANISRGYSNNKKIERVNLKTRKFYSDSCAKMMHRNMIKNVWFDTKLKIGEDSLFMAKVSRNIKNVVKSGDNVFYYVRIRQGSASRSHIDKVELIKRTFYLCKEYSKLLFDSRYHKLFILSRIAATLIHLKKIAE